MTESQVNQHFVGLLLNLHSSTWIYLGKVANPATGKPERNLPAAQEMIDLLGALEEKTRGNRVDEEEKLLTQLLTELRMNYVDELSRSKAEKAQEPEATGAASDAGERNDATDATDAAGAADPSSTAASEAAAESQDQK